MAQHFPSVRPEMSIEGVKIETTPYVAYAFLREPGSDTAGAIELCEWCGEREARIRITAIGGLTSDVCDECAADHAHKLAEELSDDGEGFDAP